ncbi:hypothetical protein GOP47_0025120 [Adiantum capillus-veneris]|uniref:Pentatricopeptide repeat-containing protein n=1 Tax=Adiantum capillus-veneris TaxID=13818 RepID=A0A9D4Z4A1_ADICA|nr:hypothetical protein GOP47_0025120 [Adiantum capillus-veneris]
MQSATYASSKHVALRKMLIWAQKFTIVLLVNERCHTLHCLGRYLCQALIAGYAQQEQSQKALGYFQWMQSEGLCPYEIIYSCILKACGSMHDADMDFKIHFDMVSLGLLQKIVVLCNALVDM